MMTEATRDCALRRLRDFLPKAGREYAALRNYDLPDDGHPHVSRLSPFIRHRMLTETEVLQAVLNRHSASAAQKFIQEVFWRTYWKGWLEMRPAAWTQYRGGVLRALDRVQTEAGLRAGWEDACAGRTGIPGFDDWARELVATGYMHNHARMWFASIWIFTLRLPWELGADFFLRHLLDGDPASNTLGWRWVAGLQMPGKTYTATSANIRKYTRGRHSPDGHLAGETPALSGPLLPRQPLPEPARPDPGRRTGLLLTEEDLSPGFVFAAGPVVSATARVSAAASRSPLVVSPRVIDFTHAALDDCATRYRDRMGPVSAILEHPEQVRDWAHANALEQLVYPYAPVGPAAELIARLRAQCDGIGLGLVPLRRDYDAAAWPHATHGFFRFKDRIPDLLDALKT